MALRAPRGQATTEAALGIVVISTVIVFGIHFSEVTMLSLKVQEASASAIWDATGKRMHALTSATPDFSPRTTAIGQTQTDTAQRYADYDGRSSQSGTFSPSLVFTQADPIQVTCQEDTAIAPLNMGGARAMAAMFGPGQGGMTCVAEANFNLVPNFTRNFLQGRFREAHATVNQYHICSAARANGQNCQASTAVLLGDWGLTDGSEAQNCDLVAPGPGAGCRNTGYYQMAKAAYDSFSGTGTEEGDAMSQWLWNVPRGGPQIDLDEKAFFLAAVGEDGSQPTPYQTLGLTQEHMGSGPYTVTPGGPYDSAALQPYPQAAQQRDACAFGLPCDPSAWPRYQ